MQNFDKYTKEDFIKLYDTPLDELIKISSEITKENFNNEVDACSIISARTGACSENCRYCAQSRHNHAQIEVHPLLDVETVKKAAISARQNGASRFAIVTSGRAPSDKDLETILEMIKAVNSVDGLTCCASLGILSEEQVIKIRNAGCKRYHHNINTSKNYHPQVCTTHTFDDRIRTIKLAQKHGLEICCGVIIGMGESREDRVDMALSLKEIAPCSSPINFLSPIPGTPFESYGDKMSEEEILKTICIFRIILPKVKLRYAGGRTTRLSKENQVKGIVAGINSLLVGNYLTTLGSTPQEDRKVLEDLEMVMV